MGEERIEYCPDCGGDGEFCPTVVKARRYICQRCNGDGLLHPSIQEREAQMGLVVKAAADYVHAHTDIPHWFEQLEDAVARYEQATKLPRQAAQESTPI